MQINTTTDYAVRCMMFLAETGRVTSAAEIGENMHVSKNFVVGIMKKLREAGLVDAVRGTAGGFYLAKPAEEITLYDILCTMENTMRLARCLEGDEKCNRGAVPYCRVRRFYGEMQDTMEKMMREQTIAELCIPDCIQ